MSIFDDEDNLPNAPETDQAEDQTDEATEAEDTASLDAEDAAENADTVIISLGEPPDNDAGEQEQPKREAGWIKELRRRNREMERQLRDLRREKEATAQPEAPTLGPEPKLEDPNIDYDPDKLAEAKVAWLLRKREVEDHQRKAKEAQETERAAFAQKQAKFRKSMAELPVSDAEEAKEIVASSLAEVQQGIIIHVAADPAKLVYALGKNPAELERLSKITDHLQLAAEIARLEAKVVTKTRESPAAKPEARLGGVRAATSAATRTLDALRAKAEKTGDYTEVMRFKRQMREAADK